MTAEVIVSTPDATPTLVAVDRTTTEALGATIMRLLDRVYAALDAAGVPRSAGHNVVLYRDDGTTIEVGKTLDAPVDPVPDGTARSELPAGRVATLVHWGPYEALAAAHAAVQGWMADNGETAGGPNWEVYGDWDDDPAKRRTDVCYLLADG